MKIRIQLILGFIYEVSSIFRSTWPMTNYDMAFKVGHNVFFLRLLFCITKRIVFHFV